MQNPNLDAVRTELFYALRCLNKLAERASTLTALVELSTELHDISVSLHSGAIQAYSGLPLEQCVEEICRSLRVSNDRLAKLGLVRQAQG